MSQAEILRRLGIGPRWVLRAAPPAEVESTVTDVAPVLEPATAATRTGHDSLEDLDWAALEARAEGCRACGLCEGRNRVVFGVGDRQADWMLIGEGPGAEEDLRGEPFVGQAGKLLDAMLAALGLARGQGVYIANTVKCRPPNNRTPEPEEIAACWPYLERQIALVKPRVILALGRPAAEALLKTEVKVGAVRGKLLSYGEIPVVVTYHPAYLLRNLAEKSKAWEDLLFARRQLEA